MHDSQFRMLLDHLGRSWPGYQRVRKGVKKRIVRHMQQLGCHDVRAYLKLLNNDPKVKEQNEYLMTVSISRFFRDREFWIVLEEKILPGLFTNEDRKIKVWSAGCACGEEVYSFKILWERLEKHVCTLPMMEILATDLHPAYLKAARSGVYSSSSLKDVGHEDKQRFFSKTDRKRKAGAHEPQPGSQPGGDHDRFQVRFPREDESERTPVA